MIAERLRQTRDTVKLSRTNLAKRADVKAATIADIEEGRNRNPSYDKVVRLARALGVTPDYLYPIDFEPKRVA